jgi:hypothetical protein
VSQKIDKFNVETRDATMGAAKIRREMAALPIHSFASAEERGPFGEAIVSAYQNDLFPSRKVSVHSGHGETIASFWQAQRAGQRKPIQEANGKNFAMGNGSGRLLS